VYLLHVVVFPFSRATLLVRLDTNNDKDFKYKPGDHLSLFPANKKTLVQSLLDRLCEAPDPDQPIIVEASREISGSQKYGLIEF
jgi:sulfite reductase alpha subunit-like flavoprotein